MKNLTILVLLVALTCGCSVTRLQRGDSKAFNARMFWTTEGFEFQSSTNGSVTIKLQKSNPDVQAIEAVARGVAQGAVKGVAP